MDDDFDLDALLREEDDLLNEPVIDDAYWEEVAAADEQQQGSTSAAAAAPTVTSTNAAAAPAAVRALNAFKPSSSSSSSSSSSVGKKKLTAQELALELQALRKELAHGRDGTGATFLQVAAGMVSAEPLAHKDPASAQFCQSRPAIGQPHVTCVLASGTRVFLARRPSLPRTAGDSNDRPRHGGLQQLLSKSMVELLQEAQAVETHALAQKHRAEEERKEREAHAPTSSSSSSSSSAAVVDTATSMGGLALNGRQLWVDKYAPQSFAQLLSSERTNRDVLKALKQWDAFVFHTGTAAAAAAAAPGAGTGAVAGFMGMVPSPFGKGRKDGGSGGAMDVDADRSDDDEDDGDDGNDGDEKPAPRAAAPKGATSKRAVARPDTRPAQVSSPSLAPLPPSPLFSPSFFAVLFFSG